MTGGSSRIYLARLAGTAVFDPLGDQVIHDDLGGEFPYQNFDIVRFEVTAR